MQLWLVINQMIFQTFSNHVCQSAGFGVASRAACNPRNLQTKLKGFLWFRVLTRVTQRGRLGEHEKEYKCWSAR